MAPSVSPAPALALPRETERSGASLAFFGTFQTSIEDFGGFPLLWVSFVLAEQSLMGCVSLVLGNNSSPGKLKLEDHLKADHVHMELRCQPSLPSLLQQKSLLAPQEQSQGRLPGAVSMIDWMWQQKDTRHELGDNLGQGILSVARILSDKNTVTGRHLGTEEA